MPTAGKSMWRKTGEEKREMEAAEEQVGEEEGEGAGGRRASIWKEEP